MGAQELHCQVRRSRYPAVRVGWRHATRGLAAFSTSLLVANAKAIGQTR